MTFPASQPRIVHYTDDAGCESDDAESADDVSYQEHDGWRWDGPFFNGPGTVH